MIEPKYFESIQNNNVIAMYGKLSQELTQDIIKRIQEVGDITGYTRSQIRALQQMGGQKQLIEALRKTNKLSAKRKRELLNLFQDLAKENLKGYKEQFERVGVEYALSREQITLINSALKRTEKEFVNLSKTIAYANQKTYVKALDELYIRVASSGFSYEKALRLVVTDLANRGVTLQDKLGRNIRLESQVKKNLFTGLTQTANDISKSIGDVIGANCVYIGHTPHCRDTHRVIDGVTMSLDKFKEYEYLTEESNCYHVVNYDWQKKFEDKRNKIEYTEDHLTNAEYSSNYDKRQEQNYYARQVRYKKEEIQNIKGTSNSEILNEKRKELKLAQSKYRTYCLANKLPVDYTQCWKSGYNK